MLLIGRHPSPMRAVWGKREAGFSSNTASGQLSWQAAQKVHSPAEKSTLGSPPTRRIMPVGHRSAQRPHPVQLRRLSREAPGGQRRGEWTEERPVNNSRRESGAGLMDALSVHRRAGRPENRLIKPDEKSVASDDTDGHYRPDSESKGEECKQLITPPAPQVCWGRRIRKNVRHATS